MIDAPSPTAGSPAPGGAPSGPVCIWVPLGQANVGNFLPRNTPTNPAPPGADFAQDLLIEQCDGEFTYRVQWPSPGGPPTPQGEPSQVPQPVVVSPAEVARQALAQLVFPPPEPVTDIGMAAQLEAHLSVDNGPVTSVEQDGPITAEVTATPVAQSWDISGVPGGAPPVECQPDRQPPEQQCTWTPNHSSATVAPAVGGERDGSPCFPATVTVTWEVTWVAMVGDQVVEEGAEPSQTTEIEECLVVGEIQALNG